MKWSVTILSLFGSLAVFASKPVICPVVGFVKYKWQYLKAVEKVNQNLYTVKSISYDIFDEKNLLWWEMRTIVYAADFNSAFITGQELAKNVDVQVNEYAKVLPGLPSYYSCEYRETSRNETVYLFAENPPSAH